MLRTRRNETDEYTTSGRRKTICAQCGYNLTESDTALRVYETGDIIHWDCRVDYFDENMEEFADVWEV